MEVKVADSLRIWHVILTIIPRSAAFGGRELPLGCTWCRQALLLLPGCCLAWQQSLMAVSLMSVLTSGKHLQF